MTDSKDKGKLRSPEEGRPISRNEILAVMADEGYSADRRKSWLKEVLTHVSKSGENGADPEQEKLEAEIREILHKQVSDNTEADDTT